MMKIPDIIRQMDDMTEHFKSCIQLESRFSDLDRVKTYDANVEALRAAISVLETLNLHKAKAVNVLAALRRCYDYPERCYGCPYHDDTNPACGRQMDDDIEKILAATYEEWGENDDEQD